MDFLGIGYHFDGEYKANSVVDTVVPSVHDVFVVFVILWRFGPENLSDCLVVNVVAANAGLDFDESFVV